MPDISLRPLEPEDLDLIYLMENDPQLWLATSDPHPYSKYAIRQYLASQPADIYQCGEMRTVVTLTPSGQAIGFIDIVNFSAANQRAEICIALLPEHRAKGYGAAALSQIEQMAKQNLNLRLIYALVSTRHNLPCKNLFLSANYKLSATLPQWHKRASEYEDVDVFTKFL